MYTKDMIKEMLMANDKAVVRGILAIYAKQTEDEQSSQSTHNLNGVGFSGADAGIMSSFAEQILKGRTLSSKQMAIGRRKIVKYAGQLMKIANVKASATDAIVVS